MTNDKKIISSGFLVMKRYKLRTFFMMLGVIIGIAALTLVLSLGKGTKQQLMNKVQRIFSASNIFVHSGGGEMRKGPGMDGPVNNFTLQDVEAVKQQVSNIIDYDAYQIAPGRSIKYRQKSIDVPIMGNTERAPKIWNRKTISGSYFNQAQIKQSARVAVLGVKVVKELFGDADPVGQSIRVGTVPFRVIGVLEPMGIDPHGTDRDNEINIPVTTLMRRVMNVDFILGAKFEVKDNTRTTETAAAIRSIMRSRHRLNPAEADDFTIITPERVKKILAQMTGVFSLILPLIAGISLLAGGIVIAALMLMNVGRRTAEIGLRKALGARRRDILLQFLAETTLVTLTGGLAGFLLGVLAMTLFTMKMALPMVIPWEAFLLGLTLSLLVGILAGILPARRAAMLQPADALR